MTQTDQTDGLLLPGSSFACDAGHGADQYCCIQAEAVLRGSARGRGSSKIATCKQTHCTDPFQKKKTDTLY